MLRNLLGPFGYLKIKHEFKFVVDWIVPLLLTLVSVLLLFLARKFIKVFDENGIVNLIVSFTQILPGFYIAALAAIATFQRNDIDAEMPEPAPSIKIKVQGKEVKSPLSRRRFLSSMFAFLTAESILIIFVCFFGTSLASFFRSIIPNEFHWQAIFLYLTLLIFLLWQLVVATFWGLYYLGDRLHRVS